MCLAGAKQRKKSRKLHNVRDEDFLVLQLACASCLSDTRKPYCPVAKATPRLHFCDLWHTPREGKSCMRAGVLNMRQACTQVHDGERGRVRLPCARHVCRCTTESVAGRACNVPGMYTGVRRKAWAGTKTHFLWAVKRPLASTSRKEEKEKNDKTLPLWFPGRRRKQVHKSMCKHLPSAGCLSTLNVLHQHFAIHAAQRLKSNSQLSQLDLAFEG